jgi:DNA repair protein RadC
MNNLFTQQDSIAEIHLSYNSNVKCADRIKITGSKDAEAALRTFWPSYEHVEYSFLLLLNRQNQVIGKYFLAKGGITGTVVDVRVIFQVALKANASSVMIAHNHPSGNLQASDADRRITQQVKEAGKILDINLLDHIILTKENYLSLADEGYL